MEKCLCIIAFLIMLPRILVSQHTDTTYYDKDWNQTSSKNYKFYRIATEKPNLVEVVDYTKSGSVQMTGAYSTMDFSEEIGLFSYYKKDRVYRSQLFKPNNYPDILERFTSQLKYLGVLSDSLRLNFYFYKDGRINKIGFMIDDCTYTGTWIFFDRKHNYPTALTDYHNAVQHGRYIIYDRQGGILLSGEYRSGKKNGPWEWFFDGKVFKTVFWVDGDRLKTVRVE
jgi:antitoxin component YwqK of YwqJK toxin-antitoxin module